MDKANTRSAPRAAWPVAVTKTLVPEPAETAIIRPRVRAIVLGTTVARLTLVCAPAGYGKTTLLAAMARTLPLDCAWYTLDEIDGDPRMLLLGLSHAVAALAPAAGPAVQGMLAGQPARRGQWRPLVDTLINALAAQVHVPVLLVLDDYHLIDETPARGVVAHLIARLPPACRLVVATRTEPGFPLARLRATGAVRDVGPAALAFGPPEIADLLRRHSGVEPAPAAVARVMADTAGWPLGVSLLLARRDSPAEGSGLERDPVRDADDFFAAEVLRDVPAEAEQFLLASCVLERFSLELLVRGAVTTREEGRRALGYLRRRHLFVEALDAEETWYRYHPLFSEMLRRTLREREGAAGLARRRRACADGCAAVGETAQAIGQYLAAGAHKQAAALLQEHGQRLLHAGAAPLVDVWLRQLPPALRERASLVHVTAMDTDARVGLYALPSVVAVAAAAPDTWTHVNGGNAQPPTHAVPPGSRGARDADPARANGATAIIVSGLAITTLGDFALARAGRSVATRDWDRRKVRELFLYLITHAIAQPGRPHSRDELIETFWPDLALPAAQQSLDVALSRLRHVLEPDRTAGHASRYLGHAAGCYTLVLGPDDALDAVTFRRAARAALGAQREDLLARAAELYGGAYLPEARYAAWAEAVRDDLATAYLDLLAALAAQRAAVADWAGAISWTQQTLREDPSREEAHRHLMRYYAASGQRDRALRQYRLCRVQLLRAVGADPSAETTSLYDRLRGA